MRNYPLTPTSTSDIPALFQEQVHEAKNFLNEYNPKHKIVLLNS